MDTAKCPSCKADFKWIAGVYWTIPEKCLSCGADIQLCGKRSKSNMVCQNGRIVEVFWYEWDRDLFEDVREDLKDYDSGLENGVYDIDPSQVFCQGNGHYCAPVEVIERQVREERERERLQRRERAARLAPIVRDLLFMMFNREIAENSDLLGPIATVGAAHCLWGPIFERKRKPGNDVQAGNDILEELARAAAQSARWFTDLLGQPVKESMKLYDVAEMWEAAGRPTAPPCDWSENA